MRAGFSKKIITPPLGVHLAGFGNRIRPASGKYSDLHVSTVVMENDNKLIAIICADIIGFSRNFTKRVKKELNKKYGFMESDIVLNASHTHSGPQTLDHMSSVLGDLNSDYMEFFFSQIISSVDIAFSTLSDMDIYYGIGTAGISINRRLKVNGQFVFGPNYKGLCDKNICVIKFVKDKEVKGVLFNFACHASTINSLNIYADFPGVAKGVIENGIEGHPVAIFLQGCGGSTKAKLINDEDPNKFKALTTTEDTERIGKELGNSVIKTCNSEMRRIEPSFSSAATDIKLDFEHVPSIEELEAIISNPENEHIKIWAQALINNKSLLVESIPYSIQLIKLADDFYIAALEGEACIDYSYMIKDLLKDKDIIVAGYSNGTCAYIPAGYMYNEGGYEPSRSIIYFLLPSSFKNDIQDKILSGFDYILSQIQN